MKWISFAWVQGFRTIVFLGMGITVLFGSSLSLASVPKSYRLQNPIGSMHLLPVGEVPGWEGSTWFQIDVSTGNIWNAPITLRNLENDKLLYYTADYEQTDFILEVGSALGENFAHSLEIPYSYRGSGFLDHFIDEFHIIYGFDRFNRNEYPEFQSNFDVRVDGEPLVDDTSAQELANIKYKIKYWPWKLTGNRGQCPCGFSLSSQVKIPFGNIARAHTTGTFDYSAGWHLGLPLFDRSAIWISSFVTYLGANFLLKDWPRRRWHQTYEVSSEWGISDNWGFTLQVRMESPFLNKEKLSIVNAENDPEEILLERVSSGWNSLVHWRGSESLGLRWQSDSGDQSMHFFFVEDWTVGNFDEVGDDFYVNNAPDITFNFQYYQTFE